MPTAASSRALELTGDWIDVDQRQPEQLALQLRRVLLENAEELALRMVALELSQTAGRRSRCARTGFDDALVAFRN